MLRVRMRSRDKASRKTLASIKFSLMNRKLAVKIKEKLEFGYRDNILM